MYCLLRHICARCCVRTSDLSCFVFPPFRFFSHSLSLLAFSSSVIFRTFFKLIISTVSFGVLVGLVFIPVVLSLVGPGQLPLDDAVHKRNADGAAESIPMENMSKSTVVPEQQQGSSVDASLYRRASLVTVV